MSKAFCSKPEAYVALMSMLSLSLVVILPDEAMAQREPTTRSERIAVVRQSGEADGVTWPDLNYNPPPSLSPSQLSDLFTVGNTVMAVIQGPWKLSASSMTAGGGRFRIAFKEARTVTAVAAIVYGRPSVAIGQDLPGVLLSLRALAAGERYAVDCLTAPTAGTYRLTAPGISRTFTGDGHVLASYTAPDTHPVFMRIERLDSADPWAFISCDISRVQ